MIGTLLIGMVVSRGVMTLPASGAAPPSVAERFDEIRVRADLPALAGFAMKAGEIVVIDAVGVRARGEETGVTTRDRWHLGSCGK
ncbi:MAG: hypothetical protein GY871_03280, partial [Actinomycetales bacterium]|nr:hypothetical protein [Actinomycetales bacterium]